MNYATAVLRDGFPLPLDPVLIADVLAWLPPWWPWCFGFLVVGFAGVVWRATLLSRWNDLVAWEPGKYWPAVAALLPPCIPIARSLEENADPPVRYATVSLLLLAVAAVQLYGQQRNNRERLKTENRITEQTDLLLAVLDEVREGRTEQAAIVEALVAEIRSRSK